jgi:UDP-galactopyranose mutase
LITFDVVIVGAGFFGCTLAEKFSAMQKSVLLIEKRNHIGGNAYSYFDPETNIEIHKYGSHIFHTNNENIWNYVNQFTNFNSYIHKVQIDTEVGLLPMPINLDTINLAYKTNFNGLQAKEFLENQIAPSSNDIESLESWAKSQIGEKLYNLLIKGYTKKQWGMDPKILPSSIITRLPIRFDHDDRYFTDKFQGLPINGYHKLFENMISSSQITLALETDFLEIRDQFYSDQLIIFSGPVDKFYDYSKGKLNWRTLDFEFEKLDKKYFQSSPVINSAFEDTPYTRTHEFKLFYKERVQSEDSTIIAREYSRHAENDDEPYYPVGTGLDRAIMNEYQSLMQKSHSIFFGGRLGSYQYLDMHMAINQASRLFKEIMVSRWP